MASFRLESMVNQPTHITNKTAACIDHMLVILALKNKTGCETNVIINLITNHLMTTVLFSKFFICCSSINHDKSVG